MHPAADRPGGGEPDHHRPGGVRRDTQWPGACRIGAGSRAGRGATEDRGAVHGSVRRSEEHTSELQSLMRISYAVFCLKKKKKQTNKRSQYEKPTNKVHKSSKYNNKLNTNVQKKT